MNHRYIRPTERLLSDEGYLYHATNAERAEDIAKSGLRPHGPSWGTDQDAWPDGGTEKRSYFSPNAGVVWQFSPEDGEAVILRVRRDAVKFSREAYTGDVFTRQRIPAKRIEILTVDGWEKL